MTNLPDIHIFFKNILIPAIRDFNYSQKTQDKLQVNYNFDYYLGYFIGYAHGAINQKYKSMDYIKSNEVIIQYIPEMKKILRLKFLE